MCARKLGLTHQQAGHESHDKFRGAYLLSIRYCCLFVLKLLGMNSTSPDSQERERERDSCHYRQLAPPPVSLT